MASVSQTQRGHDYSRTSRSDHGHRRSSRGDNRKTARTPADRFRVREASPIKKKRPEKPKEEEDPFRPQPGDVIVRMLPPTPGLTTERVLGVMGLIRIYADDYYFVYEHGEAHVVKFTFRSRDRILRAGQFTSRIYHWRFEEMATLYIYWQADPAQPGRWHKIAQQGNEHQHYITNIPEEIHFERPGDTTGENRFTIMPGDFVIHPLPVVAFDRPWGQSFELRVIPPSYRGTPEMFGAGDIVVRIRVSIPTKDTIVRAMPDEVMDLVADYVVDVFVPMYVYGFLCLGKSAVGYEGQPQQLWNGRWRYLGSDHQIFRDYQKARLSAENQALNKYSSCPILPGDIIINLDEVLHPPGADPIFHQGHIKIHGDKEAALDRAQDLPGTMLLRLGCFMSPEDRIATALEIHRTHWLENGWQDSYLYSCWVDFVTPKLIVRDQLTEHHWIDARMNYVDRLNVEPAIPPLGQGEILAADTRPFGIGFAPQETQLYHQMMIGIFHRWNEKDFVLSNSNAINETNVGRMFTRPQSDIHRVENRTYLELRDARGQLVFGEGNQIFHGEERKFSIFHYPYPYVFADGEHVIRFKCEESATQPGCWVLSVELYAYRALPQGWERENQATRICALKGRDQIILPNLIAGEARRPPGLWANDV